MYWSNSTPHILNPINQITHDDTLQKLNRLLWTQEPVAASIRISDLFKGVIQARIKVAPAAAVNLGKPHLGIRVIGTV